MKKNDLQNARNNYFKYNITKIFNFNICTMLDLCSLMHLKINIIIGRIYTFIMFICPYARLRLRLNCTRTHVQLMQISGLEFKLPTGNIFFPKKGRVLMSVFEHKQFYVLPV